MFCRSKFTCEVNCMKDIRCKTNNKWRYKVLSMLHFGLELTATPETHSPLMPVGASWHVDSITFMCFWLDWLHSSIVHFVIHAFKLRFASRHTFGHMDELKRRIAELNPNPPLYQGMQPKSWDAFCRNLGKVVDVPGLIEKHGMKFVRELRKDKLGGVYSKVHPEMAAQLKKQFQQNAQQSQAPENVPWFSRGDDGTLLIAGMSSQSYRPPNNNVWADFFPPLSIPIPFLNSIWMDAWIAMLYHKHRCSRAGRFLNNIEIAFLRIQIKFINQACSKVPVLQYKNAIQAPIQILTKNGLDRIRSGKKFA